MCIICMFPFCVAHSRRRSSFVCSTFLLLLRGIRRELLSPAVCLLFFLSEPLFFQGVNAEGYAAEDSRGMISDDAASAAEAKDTRDSSKNLRQEAPRLNAFLDLLGQGAPDGKARAKEDDLSAIADAYVDKVVDRAKLDKVLSFSLPAELDKTFDELKPEELVAIIQLLKENMDEAAALLVDSNLLMEASKMTTGSTIKQFNAEDIQLQHRKTNKLIDKTVGHIRLANSGGGGGGSSSSLEKVQAAGSHDFHRRAQREMKRAANSKDFHRSFQESSMEGATGQDGKAHSAGRKNYQQHYAHAYSPPGMEGFDVEELARTFLEFQNHGGEDGFFQSHSWMHHGSRRAAEAFSGNKMDQCELLSDCAGKMSFFDLFAYFFSDDLDPATGQVDDVTIRFDEGGGVEGVLDGIDDKSKKIAALVQASKADVQASKDDGNCDKLLQEYHRTKERNGIPEWEGASVSQVCLAENARVYIDFASSMPSLLYDSESLRLRFLDALRDANPEVSDSWTYDRDNNPLEGYATDSDAGLSSWFIPDFETKWDFAMDQFLFKQFECADEIWESDDRKTSHSEEEYVFRTKSASTGERLIPIGILKDSDARDKHGQIMGNSLSAYKTVPLHTLNTQFYDCVREVFMEYNKVSKMLRICGEEAENCDDDFLREEDEVSFRVNDALHTRYVKIFDDLVEGVADCIFDYIDELQHGLGLVFGEKMNGNFICSIKTAIVDGEKSTPGTCCLDAPYQLNENYWGHRYDCSQTCSNPGPYFAGLSVNACNAHGGTWCRTAEDCTVLLDCINVQKAWAESENRPAFAVYLGDAPEIEDPTDPNQCSRTREYFGFHPLMVNDRQVCNDMEQLRFSRDFSFLDEFYGMGDQNSQEVLDVDLSKLDTPELALIEVKVADLEEIVLGERTEMKRKTVRPLQVPPLKLENPDHLLGVQGIDGSLATPVQNGLAWRMTNHALVAVLDVYDEAEDMLWKSAQNGCPADVVMGTSPGITFTMPLNFICKMSLEFLRKIFKILWIAANTILAISESQMGEKAELDNIAPIQTGERVQALHANVATTGEYLQARFQELGNYLQNDVFSAISDELHSHHGAISSDLYDQHEMMVGQLEDHHETIGEALEEHNDAIGTMLQNHQQDIGGMLEKHHDLLIAHWNENFELRKQVNRIEDGKVVPVPTRAPTDQPSSSPTMQPSVSVAPSDSPTTAPITTTMPTKEPSPMPTVTPGPTSLMQKYKVGLNCSHYSLPSGGATDGYAGTATPEKIVVEFYDELNQLRGENEGRMTSCENLKYGFHVLSEVPITHFIVKIGGPNALGLVQADLQVDGKPRASWKLNDGKLWCLSKANEGGDGSSPSNIDMDSYLADGEKCRLGLRFAVSPNDSVDPVPECTIDTQDTDCPAERPVCSTSGECGEDELPTVAPTPPPLASQSHHQDVGSETPVAAPVPPLFALKNLGGTPDPADYPLGKCEGDCDKDADCAGNMTCFDRDEGGPVPPGCTGSPYKNYDYCVGSETPVASQSDYQGVGSETPVPAKLPYGATCALHTECTSGNCQFDKCVCNKKDSDCPAGQLCRNDNTGLCLIGGVANMVGDCQEDRQCINAKSKCLDNKCRECQYASHCPDHNPNDLPLKNLGGTPDPADYPLGKCEGDCDKDADCAGDMTCFERDQNGPVPPGCTGSPNKDFDYCVADSVVCGTSGATEGLCLSGGLTNMAACQEDHQCINENCLNKFCRECQYASDCPDSIPPLLALKDLGGTPDPADYPLGKCEGDCDRHIDCAGDMTCFERDDGGPVPPGCTGSPNGNFDYCVGSVVCGISGATEGLCLSGSKSYDDSCKENSQCTSRRCKDGQCRCETVQDCTEDPGSIELFGKIHSFSWVCGGDSASTRPDTGICLLADLLPGEACEQDEQCLTGARCSQGKCSCTSHDQCIYSLEAAAVCYWGTCLLIDQEEGAACIGDFQCKASSWGCDLDKKVCWY